MLLTKNVIERLISVKHLTHHHSSVAAPRSPSEWRKRPRPVYPQRLAVPAKLGYQLDVDGQTLAVNGIGADVFLNRKEHSIARYLVNTHIRAIYTAAR